MNENTLFTVVVVNCHHGVSFMGNLFKMKLLRSARDRTWMWTHVNGLSRFHECVFRHGSIIPIECRFCQAHHHWWNYDTFIDWNPVPANWEQKGFFGLLRHFISCLDLRWVIQVYKCAIPNQYNVISHKMNLVAKGFLGQVVYYSSTIYGFQLQTVLTNGSPERPSATTCRHSHSCSSINLV